MSRLFYLSPEQLEIIRPYFPLSHGVSRVDDITVRLRGKKKVQNLNVMWYKEFAKNFATQGDFGRESP
jgi:hypothetical protein